MDVEIPSLEDSLLILYPLGFVGGLLASTEASVINLALKRKLAKSKHPLNNKLSEYAEEYTSLNFLLLADIEAGSIDIILDLLGSDPSMGDSLFFNFILMNPGFYMGLYVGTKILTPIYGRGWDWITGKYKEPKEGLQCKDGFRVDNQFYSNYIID